MSETLLFDRGTIHQGDERFSSLSRGRQCCFMSLSALLFDRLCSSLSCRWTAENVDHILSVGNNIYSSSLQEGVTPDTATLSINLYAGWRRVARRFWICQHLEHETKFGPLWPKQKYKIGPLWPTKLNISAQYLTFDE